MIELLMLAQNIAQNPLQQHNTDCADWDFGGIKKNRATLLRGVKMSVCSR
jgi:hypothetical protein